jgi:MFS family permease
MGSSGVGAFAGSIWLLTISSDKRAAYLRGGTVLIAACMLGLANAHALWLAIVAMIALTLGTSTVFGLANTIVQERAPDAIRGRVSAIMGLSFFGILPFSGLVMSKFADLVGLRLAMGCAGVVFGLAAAALLYTHRRMCIRQPVAAVPEPAEVG